MVVPVPKGWSCQQQVTIQLPRAPASELGPTIVVTHEPLADGARLDTIVDERRASLSRSLPQFELDICTHGELVGTRVVRLMYSWHSGSLRLRQMLVLLPARGALYSFTYTDLSSRFADSVSAFESWLANIGFHVTEAERSP